MFYAFKLGFACIHLAAISEQSHVLAYLIAKGEDINMPDKTGMTPLMNAARRVRTYDNAEIYI